MASAALIAAAARSIALDTFGSMRREEMRAVDAPVGKRCK